LGIVANQIADGIVVKQIADGIVVKQIADEIYYCNVELDPFGNVKS